MKGLVVYLPQNAETLVIHFLHTADNAEKNFKYWKSCEQVGFLLRQSHTLDVYMYHYRALLGKPSVIQ